MKCHFKHFRLFFKTHMLQYVSSSLPFPEFDDLEMCTSLSHHQDCEGAGGGWYAGNGSGNRGGYEVEEESASLQHLVQDLRSQLTRCHKVIRGLQLRVRSLSATSDYASSLERTPRKVLSSYSALICCLLILF